MSDMKLSNCDLSRFNRYITTYETNIQSEIQLEIQNIKSGQEFDTILQKYNAPYSPGVVGGSGMNDGGIIAQFNKHIEKLGQLLEVCSEEQTLEIQALKRRFEAQLQIINDLLQQKRTLLGNSSKIASNSRYSNSRYSNSRYSSSSAAGGGGGSRFAPGSNSNNQSSMSISNSNSSGVLRGPRTFGSGSGSFPNEKSNFFDESSSSSSNSNNLSLVRGASSMSNSNNSSLARGASSMSMSNSSSIPGVWSGPIDDPTSAKSQKNISYELSECQKLTVKIGNELRERLVDYEKLGEDFNIRLLYHIFCEDEDNNAIFNSLLEEDKQYCGYTIFNDLIRAIFTSFLLNPDRGFFGENTGVPGFKRPKHKKWGIERERLYNKFFKELFRPDTSNSTSSTQTDMSVEGSSQDSTNSGVSNTSFVSTGSNVPIQGPNLNLKQLEKENSASVSMIASVTNSAFDLLDTLYSSSIDTIYEKVQDIITKIDSLSEGPEFNKVGRDKAKTEKYVNDNPEVFDESAKKVGSTDIIHDLVVLSDQLKSLSEFSRANPGVIGSGGKCNPKILHKIVDDLFEMLIKGMNQAGLTDVKTQEQLTLRFEDVMVNILAIIIDRVVITLDAKALNEIELFWYESGRRWLAFYEYYLNQDQKKQEEILNKVRSISCKSEINIVQLDQFIRLCGTHSLGFMFRPPSFCSFDAGPNTGNDGISVSVMHDVGSISNNFLLICNKKENGQFFWVCCIYDDKNKSELRTINLQQPSSIFVGIRPVSIDSLKKALNDGLVPGKKNIFSDFRCANTKSVADPFYRLPFRNFLDESNLLKEVEQFIHPVAVAALYNPASTREYVTSNTHGQCQLFLSTTSSDTKIAMAVAMKTCGDCLEEGVQKEHWLRNLGQETGRFFPGKSIAAVFTVDSFVGNRNFERYCNFSGNPDGTCPGIFRQNPGKGANYLKPIGGNEDPKDKATAFFVKVAGFKSLLESQQQVGSEAFITLCSQLFGEEDIELGRVITAADFVQNISPQWLANIDQDEINSDIFSYFFYRLFGLQQRINLELMNGIIDYLNNWNGDKRELLSMSTVDNILRDDVSKDYENNSGNLLSEIVGQWKILYANIELYIWVTDVTSNGLECRFLFNINDRAGLVDALKDFKTIVVSKEGELGQTNIEAIPNSVFVEFAESQLPNVIEAFRTDGITRDFTIEKERNKGNISARDFTWCLTEAYQIPAGLQGLISVLQQKDTLQMSSRTLNKLKGQIGNLSTSSVGSLTRRASRLQEGVKVGVEIELDEVLSGLLGTFSISEEGSEEIVDDDDECKIDNATLAASVKTADAEDSINIENARQASIVTDNKDNVIREFKRGKRGGSRKTRKRAKKSRRRNTRRTKKHYNNKSQRRYRKKTKTRKR
jgi:hypothetical protein